MQLEKAKRYLMKGKTPKFFFSFMSILTTGGIVWLAFPTWGPISASVIVIPIILTSWIIGWQAGLVAGLTGYFVNSIIFCWFGNTDLSLHINGAVLIGIALFVGWARSKYIQAQAQADEIFNENINLSQNLSRVEQFSDELIEQTTKLSIILDASNSMSSTLDLEKVIQNINLEITASINASGCVVSNWNKKEDRVITWLEYRIKDIELADEPGTSYDLSEFPSTRKVLEDGKIITIYTNDLNSDPIEIEHIISKNTTSLLMLPVKFEEEVFGLIEVDDVDHRRFSEEDVNICLKLAEQAGIAIHKAKLFEEIQYRLKEQTLLAKAVATITSSLDPSTALQLLCEQLCSAIDATSVYISSFDESNQYSKVIAEFIAPQA